MATEVQYRRGTANQNNTFVGKLAEITVDITNLTLRVHDGVTPGGSALLNSDTPATLSNKTINSPTMIGAITGNLVPSANITYDLGNSTNYWNNLYLAGNTIYLGDLQLKQVDASTFGVFTADGTSAANVDVGNINVAAIGQGNTEIGISGPGGNAYITVDGTANVLVISTAGADIQGNVTADYFIGNGSQLTGLPAGYANSDAVAYGESGWAGNIIPDQTNVYELGNSTQGWANVWVANTVYSSTLSGNVTGTQATFTGNVSGANLRVTTGNIYIGNTPFTRTLTVGTRVTPVTVPLASNNSFDVIARSGAVPVYTT